MTLETIDRAVVDHRVRVYVEELLRQEQADARWWAENPGRTETWPDLYGEHKARLALLERIVQVTK